MPWPPTLSLPAGDRKGRPYALAGQGVGRADVGIGPYAMAGQTAFSWAKRAKWVRFAEGWAFCPPRRVYEVVVRGVSCAAVGFGKGAR